MKTIILSNKQIQQKINRIAYEIYENNFDEKEIILIGISGCGFVFAKKVQTALKEISAPKTKLFELKINKDNPLKNDISLALTEKEISGKVVILMDDVLNTGKVLMYGAKHLLDFPLKRLVTVVLVNRRHRSFPIRADYVGMTLSTTMQEHISVEFKKNNDAVYLT